MHLAAGDNVDPGDFLLEDGRLHRAQLGVGEIARSQLAEGDEAIERLVPARHAVGADDGSGVRRIARQCRASRF